MADARRSARKTRQTCRVCRQPLFAAALLRYRNMPCAAQNFPAPTQPVRDQGADLAVRQCSACGLVQLAGEPVNYYREVIRAAAFSEEMRRFRLDQFGAWVAEFGLAGRKLLEVGCGRGEYLSLLRASGVAAHGLEQAPEAVAECAAQGLSVARGFIGRPTQCLAGGPFDAFVCLNFMEHWPDPVASLRGIAHNLVEGGLGLVEVPNFDMILEQGLYAEFISDHLAYFTAETLAFTLQHSGFEIVRCTSVWHDYILSAVVRKRVPVDVARLAARRQSMSADLHAFIRRFPARRVAIWGAGHQALATIALTGIGKAIRYVVDSAPFKQGRLTPASHLPVVPPGQLKSDPVHAIIIMAASYSDEVLALVRRDYGATIAVAVLRDAELEIVDAGAGQ